MYLVQSTLRHLVTGCHGEHASSRPTWITLPSSRTKEKTSLWLVTGKCVTALRDTEVTQAGCPPGMSQPSPYPFRLTRSPGHILMSPGSEQVFRDLPS